MMYNRHKNAKLDMLDQSLFTTAGIAMTPNMALKNTTFNNSKLVPKGQGMRSAIVMNAKNDTASQKSFNPMSGQTNNIIASSSSSVNRSAINKMTMSLGD